jgi:hypothetical protein
MSTIIKPSIGRIVWYRGADGEIRAAIVTRVNSDFNVNLRVFGHSANDTDCGVIDSVTHADPEQEPGSFPSWHWMPYQKAQAARHANELTDVEVPKTTGLTFGTALTALKTGQRVARAGWNGKGQFVYLVPASSYPVQTGAAKAHFGEGALVPYNAYLALKGADDTVSTWAPSGSDALADDWLIVE